MLSNNDTKIIQLIIANFTIKENRPIINQAVLRGMRLS